MTISPTSNLKTPDVYFGALDGFRGLLAIAVAIFHTFWYTHINDTAFFNNGPVIIDLFFVFSGFLMYRLYHDKLRTEEQAKTFLKRRFARLYPIHIVMLAVFAAFALARVIAYNLGLSELDTGEILPFQAGSAETFGSLLSHITMTHAMGVNDSLTFNPPSWTISVEFFAYFVFILMFMRCPPTKGWHFALMAVGVGIMYTGLSWAKPNMDITYDLAFFRCLGGFFTGVLTSWVYNNIEKNSGVKKVKNKAISMTCLEIFALSAFAGFVIYMPGKLQFFVAPFAFLFVLVFAFDGGLVSRFISLPLFRYLAKISYSVYMIHAIFAFAFFIVGEQLFPAITVEGGWAGDVLLLVYLAAVIGFAHLSWKYIERPGQKFLMDFDYGKLVLRPKKAVI